MNVEVNKIPPLKFYHEYYYDYEDLETKYKDFFSKLLTFYGDNGDKNSDAVPEKGILFDIELEYIRNAKLRSIIKDKYSLISESINNQIRNRIQKNSIPYFYQIEYMKNKDSRDFFEKEYLDIAKQFALKKDRRSELYNFFYELFMSKFRRFEAMVGCITEQQAMFTIIEQMVDEHHLWFMNALYNKSNIDSHINEHIGFIVYSFMDDMGGIEFDEPTDGISYSQSLFLFDILDSYKKAENDLKNIDIERYEDMKSYFEKYMTKIRTKLDNDLVKGFRVRLPVHEEKVIGAVHTKKEMILVNVYNYLRRGDYLTTEEMQKLCDLEQFRNNNGERNFEGYYSFFLNFAYKKVQEAKKRIEKKKGKIEFEISTREKIKRDRQMSKKSMNLIPNEKELNSIPERQFDNEMEKLKESRTNIINELKGVQEILKMMQKTGAIEIENTQLESNTHY